jgi:hypothetical protein
MSTSSEKSTTAEPTELQQPTATTNPPPQQERTQRGLSTRRLHHLVHPAVRIPVPCESTRTTLLSVLFGGSKFPRHDGIADVGGTRRGTLLGLARSGRHVVRLACVRARESLAHVGGHPGDECVVADFLWADY